jgi:hypothetical protein
MSLWFYVFLLIFSCQLRCFLTLQLRAKFLVQPPNNQKLLYDFYLKAMKIKCPFMKRRSLDFIEWLAAIQVPTVEKSKAMPYLVQVDLKHRQATQKITSTATLTIEEVAHAIEKDWVPPEAIGKGYYISGKFNESLYRVDCFFDGPDPDMPVHGLHKYMLATTNLFNYRHSRADVIAPIIINDIEKTIAVSWKIEGIINLPWKPRIKPWTGKTIYHLDDDGLIIKHLETWDIPVWEAYLSAIFPTSTSSSTSSSSSSSTNSMR